MNCKTQKDKSIINNNKNTLILLILLPSIIYLFLAYCPQIGPYKFEMNNYRWYFWPSYDCIQIPGTSHATSFSQWQNENDPPIDIILNIRLLKLAYALKEKIDSSLRNLLIRNQIIIRKCAISSTLISTILFLYFIVFSINFKSFKIIFLSFQLTVSLWLICFHPVRKLDQIYSILISNYPYAKLILLATGIILIAIIIFIIIALIINNGIPNFKRTVKNIIRPQSDNSLEREQLNAPTLKIEWEESDLKRLIKKYLAKGQYVIGVWNQRGVRKWWQKVLIFRNNDAVLISLKNLNRHTLIIGQTGTGKTTSSILTLCYQAIISDQPLIIATWKHDKTLVKTINYLCNEHNKTFKLFTLRDISFGNLEDCSQWSSLSYNPLQNGTPISVVDRVMTAFGLSFDGPAGFYSARQRQAMLVLLKYFVSNNEIPTFSRIAGALKDSSYMQPLMMDEWDDKFKNDCAGLVAKLEDMASYPQVDTCISDISILHDTARKNILYFDFDTLSLPAYGANLGKLFISDLLFAAGQRDVDQDGHVTIVLDEFQDVIGPNIEKLVSQTRDPGGFNVILSAQSLSQLTKNEVGKSFLDIIWQNTANKIIYKLSSPAEIEYAAKSSGTEMYKIYENNILSEYQSLSPIKSHELAGSNVRYEHKYVIPENIWRDLPQFVACAFINGKTGIVSTGHIYSYKKYIELKSSSPPLMQSKSPINNFNNTTMNSKPNNDEELLG